MLHGVSDILVLITRRDLLRVDRYRVLVASAFLNAHFLTLLVNFCLHASIIVLKTITAPLLNKALLFDH